MSDKEVRNNKAKRRISISKIIESYKNGMTYKQIGAEFEVSENAIRNRIVEYEKKTGEKIRRTRTSSKNQNIPIKELFIKYATGEDIEELANKYNISKSFVKMKVREFAEKKQILMKAINKFREECKKNKNVVNAFNLGYKIRTIAIRNGLTEEEVHEILEENKKRKKQLLLDSSFDLFMKKGWLETTISDIVKQANVAKGTFYLYYKDKYDIRNNLISYKANQLLLNAHED